MSSTVVNQLCQFSRSKMTINQSRQTLGDSFWKISHFCECFLTKHDLFGKKIAAIYGSFKCAVVTISYDDLATRKTAFNQKVSIKTNSENIWRQWPHNRFMNLGQKPTTRWILCAHMSISAINVNGIEGTGEICFIFTSMHAFSFSGDLTSRLLCRRPFFTQTHKNPIHH